jgi:phosphoglycerate kinase
MQFLSQIDPVQKKVLVRLDLDLPEDKNGNFDTTRMEDGIASIVYLWQKKAAQVTVIAHRGHDVTPTDEFSLKPIADCLYDLLLRQPDFQGVTTEQLHAWLTVKENLRFDKREEENDPQFVKELAAGFDLFVNDAFATAHRKHASIVGLPKVLPTVFGLQFEKEFQAFDRVLNNPNHPVLFILGGAKLETKLPLLEEMAKSVDQILVGGKLAVEAQKQQLQYSDLLKQKMTIADVTADTLDISESATEQFVQTISQAKTIIWNGPMGYYEDGQHATGTKKIAEAVSTATKAGAFSLIGGGDTEAALTKFGMADEEHFSHISSGGGAMMHYLAYRTLPAIEAIQ